MKYLLNIYIVYMEKYIIKSYNPYFCTSVRKQKLEPDMEQQTGSK